MKAAPSWGPPKFPRGGNHPRVSPNAPGVDQERGNPPKTPAPQRRLMGRSGPSSLHGPLAGENVGPVSPSAGAAGASVWEPPPPDFDVLGSFPPPRPGFGNPGPFLPGPLASFPPSPFVLGKIFYRRPVVEGGVSLNPLVGGSLFLGARPLFLPPPGAPGPPRDSPSGAAQNPFFPSCPYHGEPGGPGATPSRGGFPPTPSGPGRELKKFGDAGLRASSRACGCPWHVKHRGVGGGGWCCGLSRTRECLGKNSFPLFGSNPPSAGRKIPEVWWLNPKPPKMGRGVGSFEPFRPPLGEKSPNPSPRPRSGVNPGGFGGLGPLSLISRGWWGNLGIRQVPKGSKATGNRRGPVGPWPFGGPPFGVGRQSRRGPFFSGGSPPLSS